MTRLLYLIVHNNIKYSITMFGGEQLLAPWQNCLLGALVLHKYVKYPFTAKAEFDWDLLQEDIIAGIFFLNAVSKINRERHPLPQQREMDEYSRRIGLEGIGLADMLAMMNLKYGSSSSLDFLAKFGCVKAFTELYASSLAVEEFGRAPAINTPETFNKFRDSEYIYTIYKDIEEYEDILKFEYMGTYISNNGLANTALNTWGPTGTLAIVGGNSTHGLEPLYDISYTRRTRNGKSYDLTHGPIIEHLIKNPELDEEKVKKAYVTAYELNWVDRIAVQSIIQEYCDSSVSSTVNLPENETVKTVADIFISAWENGLKGITVFRDNCKAGIFSKTSVEVEPPSKGLPSGVEIELLDVERARRHRIPYKGDKLYVMVALDDDDNPLEIFVKPQKIVGTTTQGIFDQNFFNETIAAFDSICRLTSKLLRLQHPIQDVIKQLDKASYSMFDIPGIIARVLQTYIQPEMVYNEEEGDLEEVGMLCPECGHNTVFRESGCKCCKNCTYSSCA